MVLVKQTLYKKIYNGIADKIKTKEYTEGQRLPTELELANQYNVSRITSKKALDQLALDGYIKRIQGKGSYVLNQSAKQDEDLTTPINKSKGDTKVIGVIMSDFNNEYGIDVLSSMEKEIDNKDGIMLLKRTYDNQDIEQEAIDKLMDVGIDGLIIIPVHGKFYNPTIMKLILEGFPVVVVDRQLQGLPTSFVGTDNKHAAEVALNYILDQKYKDIVFVSAPIENTVLKDRVEGIKDGYAKRDLLWDEKKLWLTEIGNHLPHTEDAKYKEKDLALLKEKLIALPEVDCIFALEYGIANYLKGLIKEMGKKIPRDIAIICFDEPTSLSSDVYFTHMKQDEKAMGENAVKLLMHQINEGDDKKEILLLKADLLLGKTT